MGISFDRPRNDDNQNRSEQHLNPERKDGGKLSHFNVFVEFSSASFSALCLNCLSPRNVDLYTADSFNLLSRLGHSNHFRVSGFCLSECISVCLDKLFYLFC